MKIQFLFLLGLSLIFQIHALESISKDNPLIKRLGHLKIKFDSDGSSHCSAFQVSNTSIMTAAHCLYKKDHTRAKEITYYLGLNGKYSIGKKLIPKYYQIPKQYIQEILKKTDQEYIYDWAILQFDQKDSFSEYFPLKEAVQWNQNAFVVGYPEDQKNDLFIGHCQIYDKGTLLQHDCRTLKGMSGAPLIQFNFQTSQYEVIALHTHALLERDEKISIRSSQMKPKREDLINYPLADINLPVKITFINSCEEAIFVTSKTSSLPDKFQIESNHKRSFEVDSKRVSEILFYAETADYSYQWNENNGPTKVPIPSLTSELNIPLICDQ